MKKLIIAVIIFVFIPSVATASNWTKADIYREITWNALLLADYSQTLTIARNPKKFYENNIILGKHPNESAVSVYFLTAAIIHPIVTHFLPQKSSNNKWINRENWQYFTIGIEAAAVGRNIGIGIGFSF